MPAARLERFRLIPQVAEIAKPAHSAPTASPMMNKPGGSSTLMIAAGMTATSTQMTIFPQPGNSPYSITAMMIPRIPAPRISPIMTRLRFADALRAAESPIRPRNSRYHYPHLLRSSTHAPCSLHSGRKKGDGLGFAPQRWADRGYPTRPLLFPGPEPDTVAPATRRRHTGRRNEYPLPTPFFPRRIRYSALERLSI